MGVSPRLPGRGAATTLSADDVEAIAREVDGVRYSAAGVSDTAVVVSPARPGFSDACRAPTSSTRRCGP